MHNSAETKQSNIRQMNSDNVVLGYILSVNNQFGISVIIMQVKAGVLLLQQIFFSDVKPE